MSQRRRYRRLSLSEFESPCPRPACGHQLAIHTGGAADNDTWWGATGFCNGSHIVNGVKKPCACPYRPGVVPTGKRPPEVATKGGDAQ